jgi:hypothetical protein
MSLKDWFNKKKELLFEAKAPDLENYIGRTVVIQGKPIKIKKIVGNMGMILGHGKPKPQFYEINDEYLISMLRFHAQMTGAKDITEDQFKAFEEMEFESEKLPPKNDPLRIAK